MCRGGLLWYQDMVVFPCRVQEKYEEVGPQVLAHTLLASYQGSLGPAPREPWYEANTLLVHSCMCRFVSLF